MSQSASADGSRRERLITAGREAFGRLPYDEVSISDIAEEAGVAHGLPFHYFKNKRGLYVEVVRSLAGQLRIVQHVPPGLTPEDAIRSVLNRHIDYLQEHPYLLLGPMGASVGLDPQVHHVFDEARWDGALYTLGLFGITEPDETTRLLVQGWLAYIDSVLARWLVQRAPDRELVVDAFLSVLSATLAAAGAAAPDEQTFRPPQRPAETGAPRRSA